MNPVRTGEDGVIAQSKRLAELTTPSANFKGGFNSIFLMARPPLLSEEGNTRFLNQYAVSLTHTRFLNQNIVDQASGPEPDGSGNADRACHCSDRLHVFGIDDLEILDPNISQHAQRR